uniref:ATP synthase complex subunit 8 n=1 Tax=Ariomma lurida TaxID=316125 RepID=T2HW76_ARILU|nr:ATP synthase F0 subunit 8 [Ariomma lurida]BAN83598.1 ATPase subunit 8 [Ariomma lurida]
MPQLDPNPWLFVFSCTWVVLLTIVVPKLLAHQFPNDLSSQTISKPKGQSWDWPWH